MVYENYSNHDSEAYSLNQVIICRYTLEASPPPLQWAKIN
jgi:hypothetical protein